MKRKFLPSLMRAVAHHTSGVPRRLTRSPCCQLRTGASVPSPAAAPAWFSIRHPSDAAVGASWAVSAAGVRDGRTPVCRSLA